jgi:hypothetical protein
MGSSENRPEATMARVTQKQRFRNALAYMWLSEGQHEGLARKILKESRDKEKTHYRERISAVASLGDGVLVRRGRLSSPCGGFGADNITADRIPDNIITETYDQPEPEKGGGRFEAHVFVPPAPETE